MLSLHRAPAALSANQPSAGFADRGRCLAQRGRALVARHLTGGTAIEAIRRGGRPMQAEACAAAISGRNKNSAPRPFWAAAPIRKSPGTQRGGAWVPDYACMAILNRWLTDLRSSPSTVPVPRNALPGAGAFVPHRRKPIGRRFGIPRPADEAGQGCALGTAVGVSCADMRRRRSPFLDLNQTVGVFCSLALASVSSRAASLSKPAWAIRPPALPAICRQTRARSRSSAAESSEMRWHCMVWDTESI